MPVPRLRHPVSLPRQPKLSWYPDFLFLSAFRGVIEGITRRMVRTAPGKIPCTAFVGTEPAYEDSQFVPVPVGKGKRNLIPRKTEYFWPKRGKLLWGGAGTQMPQIQSSRGWGGIHSMLSGSL